MMGAIPTLGRKASIRAAVLNPTAPNVKGNLFRGRKIRHATCAQPHAARQPWPLHKLAHGHAITSGAAIILRAN